MMMARKVDLSNVIKPKEVLVIKTTISSNIGIDDGGIGVGGGTGGGGGIITP